jgi:hypothetical protein
MGEGREGVELAGKHLMRRLDWLVAIDVVTTKLRLERARPLCQDWH